jgi:hypothetical protein
MQSAHPGWCDPRYWRFTDIDVQHRSTPTLLTTCDHEWWFTLVRADEWTDLRHADPAAGRVGITHWSSRLLGNWTWKSSRWPATFGLPAARSR